MKNKETFSIKWGAEDLLLEVSGNYVPEEPMVMYYKDGSGYPGSPAYFEFDEIVWMKPLGHGETIAVDITDVFFNLSGKSFDDTHQELEALVLKKIERYED